MKIVKIDLPDIKDMQGMHREKIADADMVLGSDNTILKCRDAVRTGQPARRDEIDKAELLRRW